MKREMAVAAVDEAVADGIKKMFGVLVTNLVAEMPTQPEEAVQRFSTGIRKLDEARDLALGAFGTIFPE